MAEVIERKGQTWTTTGIVRDGKLYCSIDETLYLMEIGALSLIDENDLPLSLEEMYKKLAQEKGDQERNESGEICSEHLVIEEFGKLYLDDPLPDFDVYLPNGRFRKSSPGDPNFLFCIARGQPPSKLEIEALERRNGSIPLRFGQVDNGRVSFFSFNKVDLPILP